MATELVGLVASSIALAETATKLVSCGLALKKLHDDIKDVPDTISHLEEEIEILQLMVAEMEDDCQSTHTHLPNLGISQSALRYCRQAVTDLDELVSCLSVDLQTTKRIKRSMAKFRVISKNDTLGKIHDRVESAKLYLILARQSQLNTAVRVLPEAIFDFLRSLPWIPADNSGDSVTPVEIIETIEPVLVGPVQQNDTEADALQDTGQAAGTNTWQLETHVKFSRNTWRTPFGNFTLGRSKDNGDTAFGWLTRYEMPSWLCQKAWDLRITHTTCGLQTKLKSYCVRPQDHEVFRHARTGDIQALCELLRSGRASIHDTDHKGWGLLHYAGVKAQVETTRQLLLWGADIHMRSGFSRLTPVHIVCDGTRLSEESLLAWSEFDRLFTSLGVYEEIDDVQPWKPGSRQGIKGDPHNEMSTSIKHFEFFQPVFSQNHYQINICERLDYARVQWDYSDDVLRFVLFEGGNVTTEQIKSLEKGGIGPLNLVAYGYQHRRYFRSHDTDSSFRILVRKMINLGANIHFEQHPHILPQHMQGAKGYPFSTPFFGALIPGRFSSSGAKSPHALQKDIRCAMMTWLRDLELCGVDLYRYGRNEKKIFQKNEILKERWYPSEQWMRLSGFEYGPNPKDWSFEWDLMPERLSGEFWGMFEGQLQQPPVPGAWVDLSSRTRPLRVGYYDACAGSQTSDTEDDLDE